MSPRITPNNAATLLGATFALAGVAGFIPNPLIGEGSLFVTNLSHNLVHLVTAALFFFMATRSGEAARRFTQIFGVVYFLVGILGFLVLGDSEQGMLLGFIHINQLDNFLHIGLGVVIAAVGFGLPHRRAVA